MVLVGTQGVSCKDIACFDFGKTILSFSHGQDQSLVSEDRDFPLYFSMEATVRKSNQSESSLRSSPISWWV